MLYDVGEAAPLWPTTAPRRFVFGGPKLKLSDELCDKIERMCVCRVADAKWFKERNLIDWPFARKVQTVKIINNLIYIRYFLGKWWATFNVMGWLWPAGPTLGSLHINASVL